MNLLTSLEKELLKHSVSSINSAMREAKMSSTPCNPILETYWRTFEETVKNFKLI